jgi:ABC-2 type transport system permease protein
MITTTATPDRTIAQRRAMNSWRLEWLRMTRSRWGIALIAVYVFFGFLAPLLAKYMAELARLAASDITIVARAPRPADGIVNFVSQGSQTGMIVLIIVAAGILAVDARRGLATFYRTRASGPFTLIWPRFVATTLLAVTAYVLGTAAAWFETTILLGTLPTGRVLLGVILEAIFLVFAVAVVAAAATFARGTLATAGISFAVLLVALPAAGIVKSVGVWLPTKLLTAPAALVTGAGAGDYLRATAVSLAATGALLALALHRSPRREL